MSNAIKIFFGDFETITKNTQYFKKYNDTKINLWGLMDLNEKFTINIGPFSFFEKLKQLSKKYENIHIYFHNLSFDGDFILKYLLNNGALLYINLFLFKNHNKIYWIKWNNITFRCSLLLLSSSILQLGKSINIDKYTDKNIENFYDYEEFKNIKDVPKNFISYLKRDILIAKKSLENFMQAINKLILVNGQLNWSNLPLTASSISIYLMNIYVKEYNKNLSTKETINLKIKSYEAEQMRPFYSGGFTQFNPKYQNINLNKPYNIDGNMFDVNSAYPYICSLNLPYGKFWEYKINPQKLTILAKYTKRGDYVYKKYYQNVIAKLKSKNKIVWIKVFIIQAKIKNDNFIYLKNWDKEASPLNRYVKNIENTYAYYLYDEFDEINRNYHIIFKWKDINLYYQYSHPFLNPLINELYNLKSLMVQENNKGMAFSYKIVLNSIYGKLAQRSSFDTMIYALNNEYEAGFLLSHKNIFDDTKIDTFRVKRISKNFKINDKYEALFCENLEPNKLAYNVSIASYITAMQRVKIYKAVRKNGYENFVYSDTDSIIFNKNINTINLDIDNYKLGSWKLEKSANNFVTSGAKKYVFGSENSKKIAFSGVSNKLSALEKMINIKQFNNKDDIVVIENAVLKKTYLKSGIILEESDYQFKKGQI